MAGESLSELIDELANVLAEERQALLSGTPDSIHAAAQKKSQIADRIEQATSTSGAPQPSPDSLNTDALTALARYNQENGVICDAMLRHLTDATDRLRQIDLHRSYNADGSEENRSAQHALGAA
jgi:flagellar biosynthesis/type III secretory pathway chaperone